MSKGRKRLAILILATTICAIFATFRQRSPNGTALLRAFSAVSRSDVTKQYAAEIQDYSHQAMARRESNAVRIALQGVSFFAVDQTTKVRIVHVRFGGGEAARLRVGLVTDREARALEVLESKDTQAASLLPTEGSSVPELEAIGRPIPYEGILREFSADWQGSHPFNSMSAVVLWTGGQLSFRVRDTSPPGHELVAADHDDAEAATRNLLVMAGLPKVTAAAETERAQNAYSALTSEQRWIEFVSFDSRRVAAETEPSRLATAALTGLARSFGMHLNGPARRLHVKGATVYLVETGPADGKRYFIIAFDAVGSAVWEADLTLKQGDTSIDFAAELIARSYAGIKPLENAR
jgi:hypothetical protein